MDSLPLSSLTAISPIDGRYGAKLRELRSIFSEFGLIRFRVQVEIGWLRGLASHPQIREVSELGPNAVGELESVVRDFGIDDARRVYEETLAREPNMAWIKHQLLPALTSK